MGKGGFPFKYYFRPLLPIIHILTLFLIYIMSRCARTIQTCCGPAIKVIMISSILCASQVQTHNNRFRAYRSTSPWQHRPSSHEPRNGIYIVTFKNYNHSPVPKKLLNVNDLKRQAVSKIMSRRISRENKKVSRKDNPSPGGVAFRDVARHEAGDNSGVKIIDDVIKSGLNISNILEFRNVPSPEVLTDAYRSNSLCVAYYQTHWIRDDKNCSIFLVCSRNHVDAVLTCPKTFVWSNRVTNCVPANSRWDDCSLKSKEITRYGFQPPNHFDNNSGQLTELKDTTGNVSEIESPTLTETDNTSPPPPTTIKPRLFHKQHQQYKSTVPRRQRLGYRSSLRFRNKLLKRRKSSKNGYMNQSLTDDKKDHRRGNGDNFNDRHSRSKIKKIFSPRRQKNRKIDHRYKLTSTHLHQNNIISTTPEAIYTPPSTGVMLPTTKQILTIEDIKRRKKWKYGRRVTHSYVRARLKRLKQISKSNQNSSQHTTHSRSRQAKANIGGRFNVPSRETSEGTTQSLATKRWKFQNSSTEVISDRIKAHRAVQTKPTQSPLTTAAATVSVKTTNSTDFRFLTSTAHPTFEPECGVSASPLIVGGLPVKRDKWPWVVSLQLTWLSRHMCGATLIHPQWLVTAAHCMAEPDLSHAEDWRVIFANVKSRAKIDFIVKHPSFVNGDNYPNDIAMLRLKHPAEVTGFNIRHACLPPPTSDRENWDKCWIMGWGEAKENTMAELKELSVNIWKNSECSARWGWKRILNSHMCVGTGDSGACNGDSGGPLICRRKGYHYLTGVTSWGVYGCQTTGYPGVFINVASYRSWIDGIIKKHTT